MLPDFVLRDTDVPTHIEVYGMNGLASYEARKEQKRALRVSRRITAVEWNADCEPLEAVSLPASRNRSLLT
jgi:hypothetical protein